MEFSRPLVNEKHQHHQCHRGSESKWGISTSNGPVLLESHRLAIHWQCCQWHAAGCCTTLHLEQLKFGGGMPSLSLLDSPSDSRFPYVHRTTANQQHYDRALLKHIASSLRATKSTLSFPSCPDLLNDLKAYLFVGEMESPTKAEKT